MLKDTTTARGVTFNADVECHEILNIEDYTASEISASWYDDNEMEKITQRCFKIIHKVDSGKSKKSNKYCMRGLEGHTTLGSIAKRRNRSAAYIAVFDEQERHWNDTEHKRTQAISDAYRCTSSSCQMWAQVVGNRDQQAAEAHLYEDEDDDDDVGNRCVQQAAGEENAKPTTVSSLKTAHSSAGSRIGNKLPSLPVSPFKTTAHAA